MKRQIKFNRLSKKSLTVDQFTPIAGLTRGVIRPLQSIRNVIEPMRENSFIVTFPNDLSMLTDLVQSVSRPICRNVNGLMTWDDIKITFVNPISPSTQQILYQYMDNMNFGNQMFQIESLDPLGNVISKWSIQGFISQIEFGLYDYISNNISESSITIVSNYILLLY